MSHLSIHSCNRTGQVFGARNWVYFFTGAKSITVALQRAHKMIWHVRVAAKQHNVSVGHINTLLRYGLNVSTAWWLM